NKQVATKILLEDVHKGYKKGNAVCSPFSLEMVLGMLAFGAKGRTLEQPLGFLGHETMDQLRAESCALKFFAQNCEGSLHVSLANGLWVDKMLNPVKSCYEEAKAVQVINSWVKTKTKGLIPTVIQEEDLLNWEDARMVFANALHFNGTWSKPFNTNKTTKKEFHLIKGEKVSVPFMTSCKKFDYGSFGDYKILKIPYESKGQSNEFSMYIFLPDRRDGLKDLLQVFHSNHAVFYGDFDLKTRKLGLLWVPKFKISYDFEALDVVKEMGLILPFNPTNKELTGIVESTFLGERLYVSKVFQKSFIEIDEKGTKAAAVSHLDMVMTSRRLPPPPPPASFVVDHPFMFMIREDTSRAIFFHRHGSQS
ncbi:serpin-ZX, partial [Tanacetum coccineum]